MGRLRGEYPCGQPPTRRRVAGGRRVRGPRAKAAAAIAGEKHRRSDLPEPRRRIGEARPVPRRAQRVLEIENEAGEPVQAKPRELSKGERRAPGCDSNNRSTYAAGSNGLRSPAVRV